MRPQKVLDIEVLAGLAKVFRSKGYEGASLKELANATGLKKASLYHRFSKGKQEMAEAVLIHIGKWVEENVFKAFSNEKDTPPIRLNNGLNHIRTLYGGGRDVCIFRALSMQSGLELFDKQLKNGMKQWINAFSKIGIALQLPPMEAEKYALKALVEIQGSLIVTKGLGDINIFNDALKNIENRYLNR